MKLLFIYRFCTRGGVEVVLRNRLDVLKRIFPSIQTDIIFLENKGGLKIFKGFEKNIFIMNNPRKIGLFIDKGNYDLVITIDTPSIYEILHDTHTKIILEIHSADEKIREYLKLIKIDQTNTIAITIPSNYFKEFLIEEMDYKIPMYVFPNFIGDAFIKDYENKVIKLHQNTKKCVGWVGRLDKLKNVKEFIKIADKLIDVRTDVEFIIVGGYNSADFEKRDFFNLLKTHDLFSHVRWLPSFNNIASFYKYLSCSGGCFVSTSMGESFGLTVLESMICKCPIVCSNIGAFRELLDNGKRGCLYELRDIEFGAEKINIILDDSLVRQNLIENAYNAAVQIYNPEKIITDWISFLNEII